MLLTDKNEADDNKNQYPYSDSQSEYDILATELGDTSTDEHISEQLDSSNSDIDKNDTVTHSQSETAEKGGALWFTCPDSLEG
ncbi:unnamed protein product [Rotaria sp. Silwood2]|nr:unnamed protein product [Rotaria sp. Silwood2]CAF2720087.1 unnamed protein product [Rotaria sp. Silwood2]CAF3868044.1 unnamed protein product [Rotaria sp. Silwood2]CAF4556526.1 unnamed protein product [Rotaria sp. Silwood2]